MKYVLSILILAVMLLGSCGNPAPSEATAQADSSIPSNERPIYRKSFPGRWPFTVDSGVVKCVQYEAPGINPAMMRGIVFEANGIIYSVNGTAKSRSKEFGYHPVQEIWAVDTSMTNDAIRRGVPRDEAEVMVNIGDVLDWGLTLCN